jgi:hypothetical protein
VPQLFEQAGNTGAVCKSADRQLVADHGDETHDCHLERAPVQDRHAEQRRGEQDELKRQLSWRAHGW